MKCPLGISNFLEEIPSLSHSVVFLYFFALITEEGFLISPHYSLELCIQMNHLGKKKMHKCLVLNSKLGVRSTGSCEQDSRHTFCFTYRVAPNK